MRRGGLPALLAVGAGAAGLVLSPSSTASLQPLVAVTATSAGIPDPSPGSPATHWSAAMHRLVLACRAGGSQPYTGVQQVRIVSGSGSRTSDVQVAHLPGAGVRLTVPPTAHSPGGTYVGELTGPSLLPVVDDATLSRISSRYGTRGPTPGQPVAGRTTDVVELIRTSGSSTGTVAARLWLDRKTNLPLRREVLDGAGRVQQASAFTSISFQRPADFTRTTAPIGKPADLGQGVTSDHLDALRRSGWLAPGELPLDFDLVDARMHGTGTVPGGAPPVVLQLSYTDGVAVVSLFEQRGRLDPGPLATWTRQHRGDGTVWVDRNVPERVVWAARGRVYTLVSDDPAVVDAAMSALPRPTSPPSLLGRIRHGLGRLVSWVNPFG